MMEDPLNLEFIRLLSKSKWTQAEASRQLSLTPATVSRYVSGETRPSTTVLDLFRMKIGDTIQPIGTGVADSRHTALTKTEFELLAEIRSMDRSIKDQFIRHVKAIAGLVHKSSPGHSDRPSPAIDPNEITEADIEASIRAAEAQLEDDIAAGLEPPIEPGPIRATAAPTGHKASPSRGASRRASSRRSHPGEVPHGSES